MYVDTDMGTVIDMNKDIDTDMDRIQTQIKIVCELHHHFEQLI